MQLYFCGRHENEWSPVPAKNGFPDCSEAAAAFPRPPGTSLETLQTSQHKYQAVLDQDSSIVNRSQHDRESSGSDHFTLRIIDEKSGHPAGEPPLAGHGQGRRVRPGADWRDARGLQGWGASVRAGQPGGVQDCGGGAGQPPGPAPPQARRTRRQAQEQAQAGGLDGSQENYEETAS